MGDTMSTPPEPAGDQTPVAFVCPECGARYVEDGSCAKDHPNVSGLQPAYEGEPGTTEGTVPEPTPETDVDPANGTEVAPGGGEPAA
jgi:hypothetical protein